jgi:hypothetical protein
MQHSYAHIDSLAIKEVHTFWPPGTTEAQILNALVADLNAGGESIVWTDNTRIKTFFPGNAANASDRYSPDQLTDLGEAVLRW